MEDEELGAGIKGKIGELTVVGDLLRRGAQVYLPVVDMGIDFVVDTGDGTYQEVQVKSRKNPIFRVKKYKPRDSLFIICIFTGPGHIDYWTIPSKKFFELGSPTQYKNRDSIQLIIGKPSSRVYQELQQYHNNLDSLLSRATAGVRKVIQSASQINIPWYKKRGLSKAQAKRYWNNWAKGNSPSAIRYRARDKNTKSRQRAP